MTQRSDTLVAVVDFLPAAPRSGGAIRRRRLLEALAGAAPFDLVVLHPDAQTGDVAAELGGRLHGEPWLATLAAGDRRVWCSGLAEWRALPRPLRRTAVVDLIDRPARAHLQSALACAAIARSTNAVVGLGRPMAVRRGAAHLWHALGDSGAMAGVRRSGSTMVLASPIEVATAVGAVLAANGADDPGSPADAGAVGAFVVPASFRYEPNVAGALWLIRRVIPEVTRRGGGPPVVLAGGSAGRLAPIAGPAGVTVVGDVEDMATVYGERSAVLVPLFHGAGTRIKIIEAWAAGRPVISTTKGAEGLDAVDGADLLLADTPGAFAQAMHRLATDPALADELRRAGRQRFDERHRWPDIGRELAATLRRLGR